MKKLALFIFVLSLFACKKEFNEDETRFLRDFSAEIENVSLSKASVDIETRKVTFDDGDRIVVSNGTQTAEYVYSAQTQRFSSQDPLAESDSYTAYYPASDFVGMTSEGMQVTFPQQQEYNENIVREAPMKGVWNGSLFVFKNLCSIIKFQLNASEKMTSVEFSSAKASVCGTATVVGNNLTTDGTGAKSLSISLPSNFTPSQTRPVCLVVPAQFYEGGFMMRATFESGREWYQPLNRDITLQAGYINAMDVLTLTYFSGGDGTASNPYKIATVADLQNLSTYVASADADKAAFKTAHYQQVADIDFKGGKHASIGNSNAEPYSYFEGTYDGNGYKISNVVIENPNTTKAQGFFGYLSGNAVVKGMRFDKASVTSTTWNTGIIVGCMQPSSNSLVENCIVTNSTVNGSSDTNGGIVGKLMAGTIRSCSFSGTVTTTTSAKHQAAGIVGNVTAANCLVEDCSFDGTVKGACGNVGGIVGSLNGGSSVVGCTVSKNSIIEGGSIADNGINVGGVVGYINGTTGGKVVDCSCAGTIKAHYYDVGGIVGRDQGVKIANCTFTGVVSTDYDDSAAKDDLFSRLGGICGHIHGSAFVENCKVSGTIGQNTSYVGGVVGWLELGSVVSCEVTGVTVKGRYYVGGVVGRFKSGIVKSCTVTTPSVSATNHAGAVAGCLLDGASLSACSVSGGNVSASNMCAGGVAGVFSTGGLISQCTVSNVNIIATVKLAGGILGNMDGCSNAQRSKVERCHVSGGKISVRDGLVGGVLGGCNTYGIVNLCSAQTDVEATGTTSGNVGGIVGWTQSDNILIANCVYCGGTLSNAGSAGNVGGICGGFGSSNKVTSPGNTTILNCCAFPTRVSTGTSNANIAGIAGYVNTVSIQNCYSPAPSSAFIFNGAASGASRGSIYGWLRGINTTDSCSGIIKDVYWLTGFKAGNSSGNYKYVKSEQALTDAQMRNTGAVSRPSTQTSHADFLTALNAGADAYNAGTKVFDIRAEEWVMGTNGYPVIYGTVLASSTAVSSKTRVSLLGDSITTYKGYTMYPANGQYPNGNYTDFTSVTQTYWYQLIYNKMSNAVLEANSAYTGTCVQNTTSKGHPGYGFLQRYVDLGNPDVIFINGGTNDAWSYSLPVGTLDFTKATEDLDTYQFAQAYDKLIRLIRAKYPKAKVFCIIGDNVMDAGKTAYAKVIRDVCNQYGLHYAEVVFADRTASTYDKVHPNVAGMKDMANQIWNQVKNYL